MSDTDDLWKEAMQEQEQATQSINPIVQQVSTHPLLHNIPLEMTVELGRTTITIAQLMKLNQGSVIELNVLAGEPLNVYVNGQKIAQGEVVVVNDRFGIRLTDVIAPQSSNIGNNGI